MKMIKVEELHKEANGNSYARSTYMVGRYEVCIDDAAYADGRTRRSISVTEPYESGCYLPKIYYNEDVFGEKTPDFSIQTTSYGALNSEEFQKFIADQNEALEVVETLKKSCCNKHPAPKRRGLFFDKKTIYTPVSLCSLALVYHARVW